MKKKSTPRTSKIRISEETQKLYEERDRKLDEDRDAPTLPPDAWQTAQVGRFYRPIKTPVSVRIDNDVLAWLKSKGEGHLTRINEILRKQMSKERRAR